MPCFRPGLTRGAGLSAGTLLLPPASGRLADCFEAYFKHKDANSETLVQYAAKLGNGAVD